MTGSALSGDGRCGTKLLRRTKGGGLGEGWLTAGPDRRLADDGKRPSAMDVQVIYIDDAGRESEGGKGCPIATGRRQADFQILTKTIYKSRNHIFFRGVRKSRFFLIFEALKDDPKMTESYPQSDPKIA